MTNTRFLNCLLLLVFILSTQVAFGQDNLLLEVTATPAATDANGNVTDLSIAATGSMVLSNIEPGNGTTLDVSGALGIDGWGVNYNGATSDTPERYPYSGTKIVDLTAVPGPSVQVQTSVSLYTHTTLYQWGLYVSGPTTTTYDQFQAMVPSSIAVGIRGTGILDTSPLVNDAWVQVEFDNNSIFPHFITIYYWDYAATKWQVYGNTVDEPISAPVNTMGLRTLKSGFSTATLATQGLIPATNANLNLKAVIWKAGPPPVPPALATPPSGPNDGQ